MSTFKMRNPSLEKEKAIKLMRQDAMDRLTINISYTLKKRLKTVALNNNTTVTDILLSYAEKYIKEAEKKENK